MVTPLERAAVAAYRARKDHGEFSTEYAVALVELEIARGLPRPDVKSNRCPWCGASSGHRGNCPKWRGEL